VKFWNMPYKDLQEVQRVWKNTKKIVKNGNIVKEIQTNKGGKQVRITNFPSKKFSKISHVRPHAINANDTLKLPVKDRVTNMQDYTKHCFWLNNSYIKNEIYLK
ncbi:MAG: DNA mismatch repair protein, partial [Sulfurimonas sp.]